MKTVIDLFAGAGGESCGIHRAFEAKGEEIRLFAVNHWQVACETHAANFPADECICQDITTMIPRNLVKDGEPVELLWASPACTHHSVARGGKPMDDQSRCTPFNVLEWCTELDVKRLIVENVPEFEAWGPLGPDMRPVKEQKGLFFVQFCSYLRGIGYDVDWRVLNAADYGAPTTRRRLFIQAVKRGSGKSLVWPRQTNAEKVETGGLFADECRPWVPASEIIDWSIPCQPIDDRKRPLAPATMKRIMSGIRRYWGEYAEPFLVRYNGGDNRHHSIHEPVPTLDTSNRYGLVSPMILPQQSGADARPADRPCPTIATAGAIGLVQPLIAEMYGTGGCRGVDRPLSTILCSGAHHGLVQPLVMEYYGNGQCRPVSEPLGTVTCKERFALLRPENARIGFRMLQPHELAAAQSFPDWYRFTGSKKDVVKQIGNAVCPKMAEALVGGRC